LRTTGLKGEKKNEYLSDNETSSFVNLSEENIGLAKANPMREIER